MRGGGGEGWRERGERERERERKREREREIGEEEKDRRREAEGMRARLGMASKRLGFEHKPSMLIPVQGLGFLGPHITMHCAVHGVPQPSIPSLKT